MALSPQDIAKIAHLSKLEMQGNEAQKMQQQLNQFFEMVEQMRAVDTTGIEPLAHPTHAMRDQAQNAIYLRLQPDTVNEPNNRELNQQSAPSVAQGLFLVPKVIE